MTREKAFKVVETENIQCKDCYLRLKQEKNGDLYCAILAAECEPHGCEDIIEDWFCKVDEDWFCTDWGTKGNCGLEAAK